MAGVPYTFATATTSIPLSQLDANFNTQITLGNTTVGLGNTVTTIGNLTLTNATVSSGNVTTTSISATSVTDSGLTSGRVTYAGTGGLLQDSANMTFSGTALTLANDASISGLTVGKGGGAVAGQTAVGQSALASNTSGSTNSAFGYLTLTANTTGLGNNGFGQQSLQANTTGGYNSGYGLYTLIQNTTGSYNTAIGVQSLQANTTASYNTAVGYQSGYSSNASGTAANTSIGALSLYTNSTGTNNTASGMAALYANTTGSYNTAIGRDALQANTTASNNTAVGYQAGYSNTTGTLNTFLGYQAGFTFNTSGNTGNTFIGTNAGLNVTTGTGNCFVGAWGPTSNSGSGQNMTTGSKNTILGSFSGNQNGLDIRTASNYIVLSDGDGNPRGYFDVNGSFVVSAPAGSAATLTAKASNAGSAMLVANTSITTGTAYFGYFIYNGSAVGQITSTGSVTLFTSTSDQRLKENIVDAGSGLAKLANVKVRSFDWKTNQEKTDFGLIAQELNDVAPEAVVAGVDKEDGSIDKPWQIDTSALVPAMIKAIQELKAEVDSLKQQLTGK